MGWIRTGSGAKQLHSVAAGLDVHRAFAEPVERKINVNTTEHATSSSTINETYSILSRKIKDHDLPFINADEVRKHDGKDGNRLFIVVDTIVLDCTTYVRGHPGGIQIVQGFGGQDCSWQWWTFHNRKIWNDVASSLRVGRTEAVENQHVRPKAFIGLRGHGYRDD